MTQYLNNLLREYKQLDAYISFHAKHQNIPNSQAAYHSATVTHDAHGRPRIKDFAEFLSQVIVDYCQPRRKIKAAAAQGQTTMSTAPQAKLWKESRELFAHFETTGEGGELLLFILLEHELRAPQVICKMSLKTNPQVHYHGADGIHIAKTSSGISLFWGESKLIADFSDSLRECLTSIKPFVTDAGGAADRKNRDISLITDHLTDIDDAAVQAHLLAFLDKDSPQYNVLSHKAACLVGFDGFASNESSGPAAETAAASWAKQEASKWEQKIANDLPTHELDPFSFHFFLISFSSVAKFRESLLAALLIPTPAPKSTTKKAKTKQSTKSPKKKKGK